MTGRTRLTAIRQLNLNAFDFACTYLPLFLIYDAILYGRVGEAKKSDGKNEEKKEKQKGKENERRQIETLKEN